MDKEGEQFRGAETQVIKEGFWDKITRLSIKYGASSTLLGVGLLTFREGKAYCAVPAVALAAVVFFVADKTVKRLGK